MSTAVAELIDRAYRRGSVLILKRVGIHAHLIIAGVTPEDGETVTPGLEEVMLNGV